MNAFSEYNRKYFRKFVTIIVLSSILIIGLNYYSIKILSSIRAYVNGESEYSKGQKDATRFLIDFIQTSNPESYKQFKQELAVPIGDSLARVAMLQGKSTAVITKAALQGRNHPEDIGNLIWLFNNFKNFNSFKAVLDKWKAADRDIAELEKIGKFINDLKSAELHPTVKSALILTVNTINRRLSFNQQSFSMILGKASRVIANWLIIINVFFILLILSTVGLFARSTFKQLVNSQKLIIEQNNAKDEFMSIASHELKTPITSMKASLQILERFAKESPESRKIHPFVVNANKQINRLTKLVTELLDVTKIQNGKLIISKSPFLLNELVIDVIDETTQTTGLNYIIKYLPQYYVNADATRIYQVIDNLLSNAAKYSAGATEVHIWTEEINEHVKVCVQDFGPGIAKDKQSFLFDRFYRIDNNQATIQGLGLGLYICKEIIDSHGGRIGVETAVGQGSTFWFSLPFIKILSPKDHEQVMDESNRGRLRSNNSGVSYS